MQGRSAAGRARDGKISVVRAAEAVGDQIAMQRSHHLAVDKIGEILSLHIPEHLHHVPAAVIEVSGILVAEQVALSRIERGIDEVGVVGILIRVRRVILIGIERNADAVLDAGRAEIGAAVTERDVATRIVVENDRCAVARDWLV